MPKIAEKKLLRVIDANFNRAKEGLRVCEDVFRFVRDDARLSRKLKHIRQKLSEITVQLKLKDFIAAREIERDVGRSSNASELKRRNVEDILLANMQRVKESLRVLEEFSKLKSTKVAGEFKKLRYEFYAVEKKVITQR